MKLPLQISFKDIGPSPAIEAAIRERAVKLDRFFGRIIGCRVVVEAPHRRQHKGKLYGIRIDMTVPGGEIAVTRAGRKDHAHEDVYVAIRDAFDAAVRMLEDHDRKVTGRVKSHAAPLHGKIARLFPKKGYGFVRTSVGEEIYFHKNSVTDAGFDRLEVGAEVRLTVAEGESAEGPQASTVTPIGKHHIVEE